MTSSGNPTDLTSDELEALLRDPRSATEFRILRATQRLLARDGLGVSIDDIAAEADLGRRTVFRHFASRDDLVARALTESLTRFHSQVFDAASESSDIETWLSDMVRSLFASQRRAGAGLWQLAASKDNDLPGPVAGVNRIRRESRQELTRSIAAAAWAKAGRTDPVPQSVELAFALAISSFAVHSLETDYRASEVDTVDAVVTMLSATLHDAATK